MTVSFQQTNVAANASAIAAHCSGNSNNSDTESNQAQEGGSAGSTERIVTFDSSAADLNAVWTEIINIDDYDGASGNWTWRINISTSNHQITLDEVHICHVDSSYGAKNTLGSATGIGASLGSTGVQSGTINQSSGVTIAPGDKIIVIFAFDNGQSMTNDLGYTPDQIITAPGNVVITSTGAVTLGAAQVSAQGAFPAEGSAAAVVSEAVVFSSELPTVTSVAFDNSTTPVGLRRASALSGVSNSEVWTAYFLFRPRGDTTDQELWRSNVARSRIAMDTGGGFINRLVISTKDELNDALYDNFDADNNQLTSDTSKFIGLVCGYNGSSGTEDFVAKIIREGDSAWTTLNFSSAVPTAGEVDWTLDDQGLYVHQDGSIRPADIDVVYSIIHPGVYLAWGASDLAKLYDLTQTKFRQIADNGADLLGEQAAIFYKDQNNKTGVNSGSAGDFTVHGHNGNGQEIIFASESGSQGTGSILLQKASLSGVGVMQPEGTGTISTDAVVVSAVGDQLFIGVGDLVINEASLSATGEQPFVGAGDLTVNEMSLSTQGEQPFIGTGNLIIDEASLLAQGEQPFIGNGVMQVDTTILLANGEQPFIGDATIQVDDTILLANSEQPLVGDGVVEASIIALTASSEQQFISDATIQVNDIALAAVGEQPFIGNAVVEIDAVTLTASGAQEFISDATIQVNTIALTASGIQEFIGSSDIVLDKSILLAQGLADIVGDGDVSLSVVILLSNDESSFTGNGVVVVDNIVVSSSGIMHPEAVGDLQVDGLQLSGFAEQIMASTASLDMVLPSLSAQGEQPHEGTGDLIILPTELQAQVLQEYISSGDLLLSEPLLIASGTSLDFTTGSGQVVTFEIELIAQGVLLIEGQSSISTPAVVLLGVSEALVIVGEGLIHVGTPKNLEHLGVSRDLIHIAEPKNLME